MPGCQNCGLLNPPTAVMCDCGQPFNAEAAASARAAGFRPRGETRPPESGAANMTPAKIFAVCWASWALVVFILAVSDRSQPGPIIVPGMRAIYCLAFGAYTVFAVVSMALFGFRSKLGAIVANLVAAAAVLLVFALL
jgi:hypothetical protein